ncbi:hypothetical protein [Roseicyclus sp.]|uniref:hypothetical protein n=1 Tax=Roseicyclus sp. TaxID=1914329 RepID=UPI003FA03AF6
MFRRTSRADPFRRTRREGWPVAPVVLAGLVLGALMGGGLALNRDDPLDADRDGRVSRAELAAVMPDLGRASFDAMDADGDGVLDPAELAAARDAGRIGGS